MIGTQYSYLPIHQNICSGGRIFLLKTTTLTLMYLLLRMKIKNEVYRLYETIPPLLTPHRRVKFINPLKAEPLLLFWQTSLKNMKMAVCTTLSNTSASPSWPTGFNSQTRKKKKKISKFNLLMSTSTHQGLPFPGRAGSLDNIITMALYQRKFFCLRK